MPRLRSTRGLRTKPRVPGSEAALRRMIEELRLGTLNYDLLSPVLANATRQQLPQLQSMITWLGTLQSVNFKGVGPGGADICQVKFEKGSLEYRVWLGPDGKTESANVRPGESSVRLSMPS